MMLTVVPQYGTEGSEPMSIIRWEPLRELSSLQNEMNRLFSTAVDSTSGGSGAMRRWIPAMDLVERDDEFVLRADLPGMKEEDVSVEFEDNVLSISGERKAEHEEREEGFHRVERAFGAFARTLTLPKGIDPEAITAEFKDGVLEVRIPKPEESKPRRISIRLGDTREQGAIEGSAAERADQDGATGSQQRSEKAEAGASANNS